MDPSAIIPTIALAGTGLATLDYLRHRFDGSEDRFMAVYGREDWAASNMDLILRAPEGREDELIEVFRRRVAEWASSDDPAAVGLREEVDPAARKLRLHVRQDFCVDDLYRPREGIWFDLSAHGQIRVIWNHIQHDGVGLWSTLKPLFDANAPLLAYGEVKPPPPMVPEAVAIPRTLRRLAWRGTLRKLAPKDAPLHRAFRMWDAAAVRSVKNELDAPFNLVSSALVFSEVFRRHPTTLQLTVGMTAFFPFIRARNRYSVFLCKLKRDSVAGIVRQLAKQLKNPVLNWGTASAQSYVLNRVPEKLFLKVIRYYRSQIDVLVSSLPVGTTPVQMGKIPVQVACHTPQLTLPYYVLLMGTREALHVSATSRFELGDMLQPKVLGLENASLDGVGTGSS